MIQSPAIMTMVRCLLHSSTDASAFRVVYARDFYLLSENLSVKICVKFRCLQAHMPHLSVRTLKHWNLAIIFTSVPVFPRDSISLEYITRSRGWCNSLYCTRNAHKTRLGGTRLKSMSRAFCQQTLHLKGEHWGWRWVVWMLSEHTLSHMSTAFRYISLPGSCIIWDLQVQPYLLKYFPMLIEHAHLLSNDPRSGFNSITDWPHHSWLFWLAIHEKAWTKEIEKNSKETWWWVCLPACPRSGTTTIVSCGLPVIKWGRSQALLILTSCWVAWRFTFSPLVRLLLQMDCQQSNMGAYLFMSFLKSLLGLQETHPCTICVCCQEPLQTHSS